MKVGAFSLPALPAMPLAGLAIGVGVAAAVAALAYFGAKKFGLTAPNALNPLSSDNLAYKGASALTEALTGVKDDTPGVALHRFFNPEYENWNPNAPPDAPKPQATIPNAAAQEMERWFRSGGR